MISRTIHFILIILSFITAHAAPQEPLRIREAVSPASHGSQNNLLVTVTDETGIAIPSARITLTHDATQTLYKGETDDAGRHEFTSLIPGTYQIRVEKEGFYVTVINDLRAGEAEDLKVTLNHQQEIVESVTVYESPPAIDPTKTEMSQGLSAREITALPYPTTRDVRKALPLIPGVVSDATGQVHINGSATRQIYDQLDGFNITHPVSGSLEMRVSADAIRSVEVQSSRYSAQYGKGSGGVISFTTGMGDDRYRFSATNFIPSVQTRKGLYISDWTPRATFSGPLRKQRAWFFEAIDGEYDKSIVDELPAGADRGSSWRVSNLAKAQVNLNERNIFTASLLINYFRSKHAGLSPFNPVEATTNRDESAYLFTLKDQSYLTNGTTLEIGFGMSRFRIHERPLGSLPFLIRPAGRSGSYFKTDEGTAGRLQWIALATLPHFQWRGGHTLRVGFDLDRITYDQLSARQPISIMRENGTLSRMIMFEGGSRFARNNFEVSGFAQDRWTVSDQVLMEAGLRLDWDQILRQTLLSPRLAATYLLRRGGDAKLSAGIGLYHDATNLAFITRPLAGKRVDLFYARDGRTLASTPLETSFRATEQNLKAPRFLNWSLGLELKLPASLYLDAGFVERRGHHGFIFDSRMGEDSSRQSRLLELTNAQRDRYDSLQVTVRRMFTGGYTFLASYARSAARSNAVIDFNLDNPIFGQQSGGPLPWDTPNRFLSWGLLPLVKKFNFAYLLDWRDGYPFSILNQDQQLVGQPNARRFPIYFTLNTHVERRFELFGLYLALRAGFNNVTNRQNPTVVNNNIDSPQFLTFGGTEHRVFTGRIRFLGRK